MINFEQFINEKFSKIACLECDEINTEKAWQKNGGFCPSCKVSSQGVAESFINESIIALDEKPFGKKGLIIMLQDGDKITSAIFKDKKNADKFNRNNQEDLKQLLNLANKTKFPKAIDESFINEAKKFYTTKDIVKLAKTAGDWVLDAKYAIQDLAVVYGDKVPAKELDKVLANYDLEIEDLMESINKIEENLFDTIAQSALAIFSIMYAFQLGGYNFLEKGTFKKLFIDIKNSIANFRKDKELWRIIEKLKNDAEVIEAAKHKVTGPRGGKRPQSENDKYFREILKNKLTPEEYDYLYSFSLDNRKIANINKGDFTKQNVFIAKTGIGETYINESKSKYLKSIKRIIQFPDIQEVPDPHFNMGRGELVWNYLTQEYPELHKIGEEEWMQINSLVHQELKKQGLNEGHKIILKRHYTENYPAITAGKHASIRNKMLEAIGDGKITQEEFDNILKELSSNSKKWIRTNLKYFNVSEEGISLSKFGRRALASITVNEEQPEVNKKPLEMKINESKFNIDDIVYNKRTKTVGIVRIADDEQGEVKTDADGNVNVDELEKYNPIKFKHQIKAKVAPSTEKEIISKGLFNPFKNESIINEAASRTAIEIAALTGTNKNFVQEFIDKHNLDIEKVFQYVKKGKLADRMDFVTAIAGRDNNPMQKKLIKQFVNEATKKNPEVWVPGAFDKELSKMPNSKITYDVVKDLAKKHKVFLDDAIAYVEYGWDLDLQENKNNQMKSNFIYESFNSFVENELNESSLNKPRLKVMADKKLYKELSQALNGATEIEDIWNQLDPKMFKVELDKFEDIFNSWWNSNNSYNSISDFAKNATAEDVESLLIHILFSIHESVELNESISAKDIKVGAEFKIGSDIFKVEKIEKDKKFGQVVSSSRTNSDGKKYEYRDTMDEFISFLNDENAKLKENKNNLNERRNIDFEGPGLIVIPNSKKDSDLIDQVVEEEDLYGIENYKEGYWFFPEEKGQQTDNLEIQIEKALIKKGADVRYEAQY